MLLDYHKTYKVQMTVFEQLIAEIRKRTVELERMASLDSVPGWVSVPGWLESSIDRFFTPEELCLITL